MLISVYVPTCNRLELLKRAVNSVLQQTYQNFELIIVDNGSTDGTKLFLEELMHKYPNKVKALFFEVNRGGNAARNAAIHEASGDFITGLDDDDYFLYNRLEEFVGFWSNRKPGVVGLYSYSLALSAQDELFNYSCFTKASDLWASNSVGNQIFAKKSDFVKAGLYDEDLLAFQDIDMWYRILNLQSDNAFQNIKKCTYVFDRSHFHERVSTGKVSKIDSAIKRLIQKYNLSIVERSRLRLQGVKYGLSKTILLDVFFAFNLFVILKAIKAAFFSGKV